VRITIGWVWLWEAAAAWPGDWVPVRGRERGELVERRLPAVADKPARGGTEPTLPQRGALPHGRVPAGLGLSAWGGLGGLCSNVSCLPDAESSLTPVSSRSALVGEADQQPFGQHAVGTVRPSPAPASAAALCGKFESFTTQYSRYGEDRCRPVRKSGI
jgi:hypothetical protein